MAGPPPAGLLSLPAGPAGLVHAQLGPRGLVALSTTCQQASTETRQLRRDLRHGRYEALMFDDHDGRIET